jgi:hypothetical protein
VATTITGISGNFGTPPAGFDSIPFSTSHTSSSAGLDEGIKSSDTNGVAAGNHLGPGDSEVLLGTLQLQASSTPDQTTTFTVGVFDPTAGTTFTRLGQYDLDNNADPQNPAGASSLYSSATSTTFSVTTAPEPATLSLLGLAVGGLMFRRGRAA